MQIAQQKGVQLPQSPNKAEVQEHDKLAKLNGAALDRQYADLLVKDHKKTISAFEKEAKSGQDSDIKVFAAQTLPKPNEHLQMAETAAKTVRTSSAWPPSTSMAGASPNWLRTFFSRPNGFAGSRHPRVAGPLQGADLL